jgi:hypothetical protein
MSKYFSLLILSLALMSCNGEPKKETVTLHSDVMSRKTVWLLNNDNPIPFTETTFGSAVLATFANALERTTTGQGGGTSGKSDVSGERQAIIKNYVPANSIAQALKSRLAEDFHWKFVDKQSDYTASLLNKNWGIKNDKLAVNKYFIFYEAMLTISDNNKPDAKGAYFFCNYRSDSKYDYDQVFANGAAAIKDAMDEAVQRCTSEITAQLKDRISKDSNKPI